MKRNNLLCLMSSLFLLLVLPLQTLRAQQGGRERTLASLLTELSLKHGMNIAFSPTLTNKVYPQNSDLGGVFTEALTRILEETGFTFKQVSERHFYIYRKEVEKVVVDWPLPKILPEPVRKDTVKPEVLVSGPIDTLNADGGVLPDSPLFAVVLSDEKKPSPRLAVKTNLLYDLTSTIAWGVELGVGEHTTLELAGNYNPWTFVGNKKMKHWLLQPGFRWWTQSRFNAAFLAVHTHYGQYNWGGMLPWGIDPGQPLKNHRYEGWLIGGGLGGGYHWVWKKRWRIEAEIGIGYAYLNYGKFDCESCGRKIVVTHKHYFGPTKLAVNLVFLLK